MAGLRELAGLGKDCDDDEGKDEEAESSFSRYLRVCWAANCFAFCMILAHVATKAIMNFYLLFCSGKPGKILQGCSRNLHVETSHP